MKLGNLGTRFATAGLLVPVLLLAITWDRPEGWWAIVFFASVVSLHEYFGMALKDPVERWFGVGLGTALAALFYWFDEGRGQLVALPVALVAPALFYLFRFGELQTVLSRIAMTTFGVVYAGILPTYLSLVKRDFGDVDGDWVLLVLMIAWFGDTGAYFAGRFLGKRKLYPAVSPGKTWAGAFGGLAGSFLAAVLANLWYFPELGWVHGAVLTVVGSALGQCGDLIESMMKRGCGVKDSGKLLPGHGGMLDRIDAAIIIAPWVYLYAALAWR